MKRHTIMMAATIMLVAHAPMTFAQQAYPTPEAAAAALVAAAKADDLDAVRAILGPDANLVLESGDPVNDANGRAWFVRKATEKSAIEREDDDWAVLAIGANAWPFAIPLHKTDRGWVFDVEEGKEELLDRRVGANELVAISVARAFVDAQREYAAGDPDGNGAHDYATRILSTAGKRDGLYWPTAEGEPVSPFGPLVANATAQGYAPAAGAQTPAPYEGYRFKVLTKQGAHAPGGAMSYEENGLATKGIALIAWPASHGTSGVNTFIVNQLGIVFEKDLGADTASIASSMDAYDPDRSWSPSRD